MPGTSPTHSRRAALLALFGTVACAALLGAATADSGERASGAGHRGWPRIAYPPRAAIRLAERFAAREGVSFALIAHSTGLHGYDADREFSSASVSKALLLAAELRRLASGSLPLDQATRALLDPMIVYSDNRAADAVYARVGDAGLEEVAERAGMWDFKTTPGFWGGDRITAADAARFFFRLEANLSGPHRRYAMRLLSTVAPVESWGIPSVVGQGWTVWFKGGWRPPGQRGTSGPVTHQAALLEHRGGERMALAVLTERAPGAASFAVIEGIAKRLLAVPPPYRGDWPAP